ncbi:MAG: mannosyltransferase [Flavobacteriales bacterium]
MLKTRALNNSSYFLILGCLALYINLTYFTLRSDFNAVFIQYGLLFLGSFFLYRSEKENHKFLALIAILFRVSLLWAIPNLSNDFYRFIWDGRLIFEGLNPYLTLPVNWIQENPDIIHQSKALVNGMGKTNASNYTCYPPINQLAFFIPALFFSQHILGSVVVMRLIPILADIGILFYGSKLLKHLNLHSSRIYLFILNPFIILEMTGNLHFEGLMIFFLIMSFYFLFIKKLYKIAAICFALSISVKAIPLIFAPLFFRVLNLRKLFIFGTITVVTSIILFLPFLDLELYNNFMNSINLYFQKFEFNASIYYLVREIGYNLVGYNIIQTVGQISPFVFVGTVLYFTFHNRKEKNVSYFLLTSLFTISIYYFLSTTVHPWYIALPLFISVFTTRFYFSVVWSFMLIMSYSAYNNAFYKENLIFVGLEYIVVYAVLIWDIVQFRKQKVIKSKK